MSRETSADAEGRTGGGGRGAGGPEEVGPGQIYMPFVVMEVAHFHLNRDSQILGQTHCSSFILINLYFLQSNILFDAKSSLFIFLIGECLLIAA